jgi:hypothetical protein
MIRKSLVSFVGRRVAAMKAKLVLAGAVVGLLGLSGAQAQAAWPSGGLRVISGKDCTDWFNFIDDLRKYCPFVSDSDSYYGAENTGIYVDYSGSGTASSACRQSWTGSAVACAADGWSSGTGNQDVFIEGYAYAAGTPSVYDSYYVEMQTFGSVDEIWGLSHQ